MLNNYTILCAEDSQLSREMIVEYLEDDFIEIYEASNGEEAFSIYKEKKPSIIISDIEMPKRDGLSFIREIRKTDKSTPIILLTAYSDTHYLFDAVELNLVKYLLKPIDDVKLDLALETCFKLIEEHSPKEISLSNEHKYNIQTSTLTHKGVVVPLVASVHKFLKLLVANQNKIVSYEQIAAEIWKDKVMTDSALRSLIHNLRKVIHPKIISNISKQGYKLNLYDT